MAEELDLSGHFSAKYTPPEPVTSEEAAPAARAGFTLR